jgi:hypothetical protein
MTHPLIQRAELARLLGVTISCVQKWQRMRRIPSYRFGRRCVRYDFPEVLAVLGKYKTPAFQRFKQRRPKPLFPAPRREPVQGVLPLGDDRQLDLFPPEAKSPPPALGCPSESPR